MTEAISKLALLDCEDSEKWQGHEKMIMDLLHPAAQWDLFRCFKHDLPSLDTLSQYTALVLTGSHYSAYENHAWIRELKHWLQQAVEQHPDVRILGICFGSQVLAAAFGGEVGKNPSGKFVLQVETLQLSRELQQCEALRQAVVLEGGSEDALPAQLGVIESHGDQVLRLPFDARMLARSSTAAYEIWAIRDSVLAVQGHAELSSELVMEKIFPAIAGSGRLSAEEAESSRRSLEEDSTDAALILQFMRQFTLHGLQPASGAAACPAPAATVAASYAPAASHSGAAPSPSGASVRMASSSHDPASQEAVEGVARELAQQAQRSVGAELQRGPLEQQLLQQLNDIAAQRVQQMVPAVAAAKRQLEAVRQQQEVLLPALQAVDTLEQQIGALEQQMSALEATATRAETC